MSDHSNSDRAKRVATTFDRSRDPLADYESQFQSLDVDPFKLFIDESINQRDVVETTVNAYRRVHRQWRTFMQTQERHPACPAERHVAGFIEYLQKERENHPNTTQAKLRRLNKTYELWQTAPEFPHPSDFNPVALAMSKVSFSAASEQKEFPSLSVSELRGVLRSVTNLRDRLMILMQLKLGVRASELCNIKLAEFDIQSSTVKSVYSNLGSHWSLNGRPNAVYIPHDRTRNKSGRPRVLPLDTEVQELLERYLFARPDVNEPWVFLSKEGHHKLTHHDVASLWQEVFRPMYEETKHHRAVGSHYGRHFFTTYWRVEQDLNRPLIKYMRGDRSEGKSITDRDGIDEYIHTYYEDIEGIFREQIYQLTT